MSEHKHKIKLEALYCKHKNVRFCPERESVWCLECREEWNKPFTMPLYPDTANTSIYPSPLVWISTRGYVYDD